MSAIATIERVLRSNLLTKELVAVPTGGASSLHIDVEEMTVGRPLSSAYRAFLTRWNGLDLEVLRLFGGKNAVTDPLSLMQPPSILGDQLICFGSDPSGFLFCEDRNGRIFSFDTDGGQIKKLAEDFDDFIERVVFGPDGDQFAGEDWLNDLRAAGII